MANNNVLLGLDLEGKEFKLKSQVGNLNAWIDKVDVAFFAHSQFGTFTADSGWYSPDIMVRGKKEGNVYKLDEIVIK